MDIRLTYTSLDRIRVTRRFKTIKGAQRFAQEWVGETPELGTWYAVSADGVGRISEVQGCSLRDLFPQVRS